MSEMKENVKQIRARDKIDNGQSLFMTSSSGKKFLNLSFTQRPGAKVIKLFTAVNYGFSY
jgi:hypothetical protein